MFDECEICGSPDHKAEAHGEPTTLLQPSNYNMEEFQDEVLSEAEAYGINVDDLREEAERLDAETGSSVPDDDGIVWDAEQRLSDAGYFIYSDFDTFAIYPPKPDLDAPQGPGESTDPMMQQYEKAGEEPEPTISEEPTTITEAEGMHDKCEFCGGRGYIKSNTAEYEGDCPECGGTGMGVTPPPRTRGMRGDREEHPRRMISSLPENWNLCDYCGNALLENEVVYEDTDKCGMFCSDICLNEYSRGDMGSAGKWRQDALGSGEDRERQDYYRRMVATKPGVKSTISREGDDLRDLYGAMAGAKGQMVAKSKQYPVVQDLRKKKVGSLPGPKGKLPEAKKEKWAQKASEKMKRKGTEGSLTTAAKKAGEVHCDDGRPVEDCPESSIRVNKSYINKMAKSDNPDMVKKANFAKNISK